MADSGTPPASVVDFKKLELRTARIIGVREHPGADRLWILTVDIGEGKTKEIVAGIRAHYAAEALAGKTVILVNNIEPAVIRGITSSGMLLAAKSGETLTLLTTDRPLPAGSVVS